MIIKSIGKDELDEWDIDKLNKADLNAEEFVYHYENYGYEGSGFAVWFDGKEWSYQELGHCSCYGPLDNITASNKMKVSKDQLLTLIENYYKVMPELTEYVKLHKATSSN